MCALAAGCAGDDGPAPLPAPDGGAPDVSHDAVDATDTTLDVASDAVAGDTGGIDTGASDSGGADVAPDSADATPDVVEDVLADAVDASDVAPDAPDASPDAEPGDTGAPDAVATLCGAEGAVFPSFAGPCTSDADCLVREHQVDCCGTLVATGVSVANEPDFLAAEALCQSQYGACGCASQPTVTDDGYRVESLDRVMSICESGACFTYALDVPPAPTDALEEWLAFSVYKTWEAESAPHESAGPHFGKVRTFVNPILHGSLALGATTHPKGAAAVKELYGAGDVVEGYAVLTKTGNSDGGKGFRWYEEYQGTVYADGPGVSLCTGCHLTGTDFVLTPYPLQ
jgi:hypothetical protein